MNFIINGNYILPTETQDQSEIFANQIEKFIKVDSTIAVLSSFPIFIFDYYGAGLISATAPYTDTMPDTWNDLMPGVKVWYCSEGKASIAVWQHLIKTTRCDVVYINGVYSPKFSLLPLIAAKLVRFKNVIVAPRGMLAGSAINVKKGKKQLFLKVAQWLRLYKNALCRRTAV